MKSHLLTGAAVGAWLAAMTIGAGAACAQGLVFAAEQGPDALPVQDVGQVNTDNGVHAVPSGTVTEAPLDARPGAATPKTRKAAPATASAPAVAAPLALAMADDAPAAAQAPPAAASQTADAAADLGPEARAAYGLPPAPQAAAPDLPADVAPVDPDPMAHRAPVLADAPPARMQLARYEPAAQPDPYADGRRMQQHVAFPRRSAEAAAAFDHYMHGAAGLDADFKSGAGVAAALKTGSGYDFHQLEEGMIAYGAMAALQEPGFVYAVMDAAADPRSRQALAQAILADPGAVARIAGADAAAARAQAAIAAEAGPVVVAGKALKQASYDVQHQAWSKATVSDGAGRLAGAKALSAARQSARDEEVAHLLVQISTLPAGRGGGNFTPVAEHSLALAALSVLGAADGSDPDAIANVVNEPVSTECLKMAKLNLFQCLSVAGPEYEDVYCLGQHGVLDTGQCVEAAAGGGARTMLVSALPAEDRSRVMIPVGGSAGGGDLGQR